MVFGRNKRNFLMFRRWVNKYVVQGCYILFRIGTFRFTNIPDYKRAIAVSNEGDGDDRRRMFLWGDKI